MTHVLLVDDHAVVREGVKRILAGVPDIVVAGEAEHARDVYAALATDAFDLVLLDVSLPQHNGLEILTHLHSAYSDLPVLIFSVHPERQYVVRALQEGAAGYLLKSSAPRELVTAIRKIAQGERYVSSELVDHLMHEVAGTESPLHESLTPRERQVMHRLVTGQALKEIAYELGLSIKTVSTHRRRLLDKLRLNNTPDLVRYAIQHELTE
jgi:two-component system invasion response regulator UvrY